MLKRLFCLFLHMLFQHCTSLSNLRHSLVASQHNSCDSCNSTIFPPYEVRAFKCRLAALVAFFAAAYLSGQRSSNSFESKSWQLFALSCVAVDVAASAFSLSFRVQAPRGQLEMPKLQLLLLLLLLFMWMLL